MSAEAPLLYRIARWLVRGALGIYFRRIETIGREHMPSDAPVILAANHPHSITDALVLGAAAGRPVHYLAHGGLFARPLQAWFLRQCGVIPVHRPRDDDEAGQKNQQTFAACTQLLARGGVIGIFPEGTSQEERRVQPIRTGVSRIALESEQAHDFGLGVQVVPVGLNFESARRFRSRVLLRFDKAVEASSYRERYREDPVAAVREMTEEVGSRIRRSVVNIERAELEELIKRVERRYHEHLMDRADLRIEGESEFQRRQTLLREIATAVQYFFEREPEVIWQLGAALDEYEAQLRALRVQDELIREGSRPGIRSRWMRLSVLAAIGALPGGYGLFFNYPPYRVTGPLAETLASDHTKTHYFQLWIGFAAFVIYYGLAMWWLHSLFDFGWRGGSILLASWPITGLFARVYVARLTRERRMLRYAVLTATHGAAIQQMRRLRHRLVAQMDGLLRRYLPHRARMEADS